MKYSTTTFGKLGEFIFEQECKKRGFKVIDVSKRWARSKCDFIVNGYRVEVGIGHPGKDGRFHGNFNKKMNNFNDYDFYFFTAWYNEFHQEYYIIPSRVIKKYGLGSLTLGRRKNSETQRKWHKCVNKWNFLERCRRAPNIDINTL